MKDKEIELKFVINEKIKESIISDLKSSAKFVSEARLIDTYYIPNFKDFEINGETVECVRIREDKKGVVLTYKKIHRESFPVYCDEYETQVSSKDELEKILFALGFEVQMVVDKTRLSYSTNEFEFDFDSVKGLGELMEIELKNENEDVDAIYKYVSKYGLDKSDVTYEGIQMMMKKAQKSQL